MPLNELVLELEEIAPKEFFGPQNINIELLKRYSPMLKIVARGYKITAFGDEELLEEFDKRMEMLFSHFTAYNNLDENMIERIPIAIPIAFDQLRSSLKTAMAIIAGESILIF